MGLWEALANVYVYQLYQHNLLALSGDEELNKLIHRHVVFLFGWGNWGGTHTLLKFLTWISSISSLHWISFSSAVGVSHHTNTILCKFRNSFSLSENCSSRKHTFGLHVLQSVCPKCLTPVLWHSFFRYTVHSTCVILMQRWVTDEECGIFSLNKAHYQLSSGETLFPAF